MSVPADVPETLPAASDAGEAATGLQTPCAVEHLRIRSIQFRRSEWLGFSVEDGEITGCMVTDVVDASDLFLEYCKPRGAMYIVDPEDWTPAMREWVLKALAWEAAHKQEQP